MKASLICKSQVQPEIESIGLNTHGATKPNIYPERFKSFYFFFFFFFTVSPAYRVSNTGENENPKIYKNAAITTSLTVHSHPVKENRVDLCIICNKIFINAQHMWEWSNEYFQFSYFATWGMTTGNFPPFKGQREEF